MSYANQGIVSNEELDGLIGQLADSDIDVKREVIRRLGEIGDAKALRPLMDIPLKKNKGIEDTLEKTLIKLKNKSLGGDWNLGEQLKLMCRQCFCRFDSLSGNIMPFDNDPFTYFVCRHCHRDTLMLIGIYEVVLVMDHKFEELSIHQDDNVSVNWFKWKKPFDLTHVEIKTATDYELEEMVMILNNGLDKKRRKKLRFAPLTIAADVKPSKAKLNLLKATFRLNG